MKTDLPHLEESQLTPYIRPSDLTRFESEEELRDKALEWGLINEKAKTKDEYWYKGKGYKRLCKLVGYDHPLTCVVEFQDGNLHNVHYAYLKEMQAASFSAGVKVISDDNGEGEPDSDESGDDTDDRAKVDAEQLEVSSPPAAVPKPKATMPGVVDISDPENFTGMETKPAKATKKEKKPKINLPEDKVAATATIEEFTTKYNHFNETEDEIIVYKDVVLTLANGEELAIESAWSSNSNTLKKLELELGGQISFEAKFADRKLNKEVRYKINNPSKIKKL
ncbi:hypothetical protein SY83_20210 [Paenibacillus swuensis]|uniref:Uncharacterized protein n=1 Tax=Paenibacillus swuensis TaxID=1178515 RepID=A0A172TMH2_9BACL|nr:hypothetical protein [Paenibacillus swuensis]ANE48228.1 hypothetical protein SY83_20210 [Paenibacillus swuensis]